MPEYRIVCTRRVGVSNPRGHSHITHVGTGSGGAFSKLWTMGEVFAAMAKGTTFHIQGKKSGKIAQVLKQQCPHCTDDTLVSAADAVEDNQIDKLPTCE